ncbi:MAG: type 4a pilus biogenesis protein PilO [Thermodesulfobacteriota bacterium]
MAPSLAGGQALAMLETRLAPLSVKHKIAILVAALTLPTVLCYFLVFSPRQDEISGLTAKRQAVSRELKAAKDFAAQLDQHRAEMEAAQARLAQVAVLLPQQKEIPRLLTDISGLGTKAGLDFVSFQPRAETVKDFYAEIPVDIAVQGPYHNLGSFFYEVSQLPRIVSVSNMRLGGASEVDGIMMLSSSFSLVTYRFVEPSADDKKDDKAKKDQDDKAKKKKKK